MKKFFVKIIEKIFGVKITKVASEEKKQEVRDNNYYEHLKNKSKQARTVEIARNDREISDEEKQRRLDNIQSEIFSKGYKAIPEILSQYPEQIVMLFVMMQKVALGDYAPEIDILDDTTHEELVQIAVELNKLQYEKRMIETGKANISKAQRDLVNKLRTQFKAMFPNETLPKEPTNKFEASDQIEYLNEKVGFKKEKKEYFKNMTVPQYNKLRYLCATLDKEMPEVASVKEASEKIQELVAELEKHPELNKPLMCTEPQLDYMRRLYKREGKRWTKQSANKFMKLTRTEMSNAIQEKKAELDISHPESNLASPGQITYMKDLMNRLSLPYNPDDLPKMSKDSATKKIDELRRKLLYIVSIGTTNLSKKEIKEMPSVMVRDLLKEAQMEKRTNYYTDDIDDNNSNYATV